MSELSYSHGLKRGGGDRGGVLCAREAVARLREGLRIARSAAPLEVGAVLSIHLQSNRPENFTRFLDSLEETADDFGAFEVVVKIDDTDIAMNELLAREVVRRPFQVRYISTPLRGGFFELWRSMDEMLEVCNPKAYFVINLNDEVYFMTPGWDSVLREYIGLFPDHIFRLRTSEFRFRNYFDFWECGFAPDTSAITTKRWLEIGGGWTPCMGPDTFQQCVAYYFAYHQRFNKQQRCREVQIYDLVIGGEGAYVGLTGESLRRRLHGAVKAWYRLTSHEMQEEASRRASKLEAQIWVEEREAAAFRIRDNGRRRCIEVRTAAEDKVVSTFDYRLSRLRIGAINLWRRLGYAYYSGGGTAVGFSFPRQLIEYLVTRYPPLFRLWDTYRRNIEAGRRTPLMRLRQSLGKVRRAVMYVSSVIWLMVTAPDQAWEKGRRRLGRWLRW